MKDQHPRLDVPADRPMFWEPSLAFLKFAIASIFAGSAVVLTAILVVAPDPPQRAFGPVGMSLVAAAAWYLLARGRIEAAVYVLALGLWAHVTGMAYFTGGVHSTITIIYPQIILLFGWMIGIRAAVAIALLTVATTFGFVLAESWGALPLPPPTPPAVRWIVQSFVFATSVVLVAYFVRAYAERLQDARKLGSDLALRTAEVQAREADLNHAQAVGHIGSWVYDIATDVVRLSAETCRILGVPEGSRGSHESYLARVHAEDRSAVDSGWRAALKRGEAYDNEHRIVVGETTRWIRQRAELEFGADGTPLRSVGTMQDITERKRTEAHLRLAASVFDHMHEAIAITDANANIVTVNRRFTEITGYSADEAIGRNPRMLKSGRQGGDFYQAMWACIQTDGYWSGEVWNRHKNGRVFPEWLSISAVRDERGDVINYVAVFVDISQRVAAEQALHESEARFRSLSAMSSDFYWESDADHRLTARASANKKLGTVSMFQRGAQIGERRWEIPYLSPEEAGWQAHRAVLDAHLPFRNFELSRLGADGAERHISISGDPVLDASGAFKGYRGVGTDITERKRHEEELQRLNEELERRVAERTIALEVANQELEAFSYSVSHDLRAPLRAISGFSRLVETEYAGKLDEQGKDYLRRVSAGAEKMGQLIHDLLSLSRVSRTEMQIEPVDLSALARELAEELQAEAPERKVEWVIAPHVTAGGDPGLLRVVLQNLIGNAWKYSSRRDDARIEFGVGESDGRRVYFVRDNGAGFDMAYAKKLFGAFQRLHSTTEFPGSGIGLATVARILHRHGGTAWAEARVGAGASFYFSLGSDQRPLPQ